MELRSTRWKSFSATRWLLGTPFISEHRSDGEVVVIPNTFKEAMETPQAAEWKEAADKEMASQEKHERGVRLRVFGLGFLGGEGHRD